MGKKEERRKNGSHKSVFDGDSLYKIGSEFLQALKEFFKTKKKRKERKGKGGTAESKDLAF